MKGFQYAPSMTDIMRQFEPIELLGPERRRNLTYVRIRVPQSCHFRELS
jgi:hypothetical protein